MTGQDKTDDSYKPAVEGDTEEDGFLRSTPWLIDANPQDPDSLIMTLDREVGRLAQLAFQPRFTLVAVLNDTRPAHLDELILSARCQSYRRWELVLVDDGSKSRAHLDVARRWASRDERIRLISSEIALGPSGARNRAFDQSTGEYLIVTDDDGVLHPMALGVFARLLSDPKVNFVFANEAEIDRGSTELSHFLLKPPFDLFTLLRVPYIGRLYAVSRQLIEAASEGGPVFRHDYDGIEEHDLLLRLALTGAVEPRHVALFTYYRRAGSGALTWLADEQLRERRRRLVNEFVPQVYPGATWSARVPDDRDRLASSSIWLTGLAGAPNPKLLVIVPFKDEVETTIQCLESIERQEHQLDVVVALVNNRSTQESTLPRLRSWIAVPRAARHEILDDDCAFNFAKLNNGAVARLGDDRDLILLLNNDAELSTPQALQTMATQLLADPAIGFVGIKLYYPGGDVQHGGVRVGEFIVGSGFNRIEHCHFPAVFVDAERISFAVTFASAMTRRETYQRLGGLDETFLPNGYGDVDMCVRALAAGYRNYYLGSLSGFHHESKSRGFMNEDVEISFLHERNEGIIAAWRHWELNRSARYAWPLPVVPQPYEVVSAQARGEPALPSAAAPQVNYASPPAIIALPLRYRVADRLNGAIKFGLGPLHRPIRSSMTYIGRGYRLMKNPGALVGLGRRVLGPIPGVGHVARESLRRARRLRRMSAVGTGLLKRLRRDPESAQLLSMGLHHGGSRGLRQAIQILAPSPHSASPSPQEWFERTRPNAWQLARLRLRRWPARAPRFTVIMPVYNVREEWLRQAITSVIKQTYARWELICVNDASTAPHIKPVIEEMSALDRRVRVIQCAANGGVSVATNTGLAAATGDYIAFMDHDDRLEPHALDRFAEVVLGDEPDMIYSDEALTDVDIDRILCVSSRSSFSYDYYLSHPYFVHLIAARTEIVRRIGGLNEAMTISQDIDLVLRLIESCRHIAHIPEVLYRWRTHAGSLGHELQDKVYAMTRGALERHFQRIGVDVEFDDKTNFNIRDLRFARKGPARVAIIIPTKDNIRLLRRCISSLECTVPPELTEVIIVDQASEGPRARELLSGLAERYKVLHHDGRCNYSFLYNRGAAASEAATHYLFLHDDTEAIAPGWLDHMLGYAQRGDVGIVGATLLYPDETIQHAGTVIGLNGVADTVLKHARFHFSPRQRSGGPNGVLLSSRDVTAVSAACLLVRADVFCGLAGFDEELADGYAELDLCIRARALGYKVIQDAYAVLNHAENEGRAFAPETHRTELQRFVTRDGAAFFSGDLFFSPFLSRSSTDMALTPAAKAPSRLRWTTTRIVLPGGTNGSKSRRVDAASPARPAAEHVRACASAAQSEKPWAP
jgi:GT2 family glycosyltransferase